MATDSGPGYGTCEYLTCQEYTQTQLTTGSYSLNDGTLLKASARLCKQHRLYVLIDQTRGIFWPSMTPEGWVYTGSFDALLYA